MGKIQFIHSYHYIISLENLLEAWEEFIRGKRHRRDMQEFELNLMSNILTLHKDLKLKIYRHSGYTHFAISDPKPRDIHKATVRDRLLHHAIYRRLYPFFDKTFIADSYSCRVGKGTHKALNRFRVFTNKVSKNNTKTCWVLKCDVRKFFANIDHQILLNILSAYVPDKDILWLLEQVIKSFCTVSGRGLPLGNLTSQLFVNIYMNKFDQFVKHGLRAKYYIRYADDFIILGDNKECLENRISKISNFLQNKLKLELHSDKISIKSVSSGVDFLGMINFPDHRVLRTKTKRRMLKKISKNYELLRKNIIIEKSFYQSLESYKGMLKHCYGYAMIKNIEQIANIYAIN